MLHWYEPLLAFLAEQPPETTCVTLTLNELEVLAGQSLPVSSAIRTYWWRWKQGAMRPHLVAIGWQVVQARGRPLVITFGRQPADTSG